MTNFLMTRTEMVLETLVSSPFNLLTPRAAQEHFIEDFCVLYVRGKIRLWTEWYPAFHILSAVKEIRECNYDLFESPAMDMKFFTFSLLLDPVRCHAFWCRDSNVWTCGAVLFLPRCGILHLRCAIYCWRVSPEGRGTFPAHFVFAAFYTRSVVYRQSR